ncbi:YHYH domain-containing protein [Bacillus cereus]|uniref:YHYH domain-containing protein n=1 Tax=Bacillus cereus TaxID=1396 RepID=UPI001F0AF14A|nr:YHYH domain-containing protein [Bacillus cereus]
MKKKMKILAMAVGLTVMGSTTAAYASPGGLDKNGGHTCRTNCGKYGLATGEYHYHKKWKQENGKWYYYDQSGTKAKGWQQISGVWYYFNGSGVMQTGWQQISGIWYYMNGSGAMQKGWQQIGGTWYYMNGSGAMQKGWQQIGGVWYYMNGSGAMQTGWQAIGGKWYYMNGSGAMQTGWIQENGKWYYLESNGAWNPNAVRVENLSQYEGFWSDVKVPNTEDLSRIPTHLSASVDFISGNKAKVSVGYTHKRVIHHAGVEGTVTFKNNKAVLHFDDDGWAHSGKIEFTLKDNKVYLNISIDSRGSSTWGLPAGQHTLVYKLA